MIYEYLLADLAADVWKFQLNKKWLLTRPVNSVTLGHTPAFLNVCKKLRRECLGMYLSLTDFVVDVSPKNEIQPAGYDRCIQTLSSLGVRNVRRIKSLAIVNNQYGRSFFRAETDHLLPLIEHWNRFIPALLKVGVQVHQFRWHGLCPLKQNGHTSYAWTDAVERMDTLKGSQIIETAILYLAIVEPTLEANKCLDPRHPVANVLKQALELEFIHSCDKGSYRDVIVRGWTILNNKRWEMKYKAVASPSHFEDLARGPGKQSYKEGQKRDRYRDWQHSWHV